MATTNAVTHKTKILLRNDTLANWKKSTLILEKGEVAVATDTAEYRVGTGVKSGTNASTWSNLPAPKAAIVLNRAPVASDSDYQPGQLWIDTSDSGRLYVMDVLSNWKSFTFYEEYEQCMLTEEYVGDTAVKAVKMADSLKTNGKYAVVDDNTNKGLWSASNTEKKIKNAKDEAIQEAYDKVVAEKGVADGFASLDSDGKVPAAQLPSYVDDVLEVSTYASLPKPGEVGKIYVVTTKSDDTHLANSQYRWSGTQYVPITAGNIVVADGSAEAYPNKEGKIDKEVIEAMASAINGSTRTTFNQSADSTSTIVDRLTLLEDFKDRGIKDCVLVRDATGHDTTLIETVNLAQMCVTNEKLALNAVVSTNIKDLSVTTAKIAKEAVTGAQIANKTIGIEKLSVDLQSKLGNVDDTGGVLLTEGCISSSSLLADGVVTDEKISGMNWGKLTLESNEVLVLDGGNATS